LGTSDACVNEVMRHESKDLYGVQFHPEISGNNGMILLQNFYQICLEKELKR
jgi:GMP synthase-like glutamine amidotransferase